jgi:archaellum component FlaC
MNLPFVLDVAIGLVFTYLILSLLASELQELLATVLQWRAKHLKDSIENLLSGGSGSQDEDRVRHLVDRLYSDPLIENVNQQAKGLVSTWFRRISSFLFPGNRKGAFGGTRSTGPSYIASETFATSIIEEVGITSLINKLTEVRFEKFVERIIGHYSVDATGAIQIPSDDQFRDDWERGGIRGIAAKAGIASLQDDAPFQLLVDDYDQALRAYKNKQASLATSVERMGEGLDGYIEARCDPSNPDQTLKNYARRLKSFKLSVFGEQNERAILSGGLKPSIAEIAELVNYNSNTYKEVAAAYERLANQARPIDAQVNAIVQTQIEDYKVGLPLGAADQIRTYDDLPFDQQQLFLENALKDLTEDDRQLYEDYQTYKKIRNGLNRLPDSVKESLAILARRAQTRVHQVDNELQQFQDEIALWFDRSMSRASGVYKRNAKGVAILLGICLAAGSNADTFHIFNRLSSDDSLRRIITDRAASLDLSASKSPRFSAQLEDLKNQTDAVLRDIAFPISWSPANLERQLGCPSPQVAEPQAGSPSAQSAASPTEGSQVKQQWAALYQTCVPGGQASPDTLVPLQLAQILANRPLGFLRMLSGWILSGIAIAMGAPFWFDLLGKLVNVRNSGGKPQPKTVDGNVDSN